MDDLLLLLLLMAGSLALAFCLAGWAARRRGTRPGPGRPALRMALGAGAGFGGAALIVASVTAS